MLRILYLTSALVVAGMAIGSRAQAGPYIFAGTDADDHGFASGGTNEQGWLFMQRAIENLGAGVTNGNKSVVILGSDPTSTAANAATSAFSLSSLPGLGWTSKIVNTAANLTSFLTGASVAGATLATTGLIMLDSGQNVTGGLDSAEETALATNAVALNSFLGSGGAIFSQANNYGFLSALVPTLGVSSVSNTGITLTAAGNASFPGLTNADLSAGPYHNQFTTVGTIPVLGVDGNRAIIIGSSGGTITNPNPPTAVPEPATLALLAAGMASVGMLRRRS